MKAAGGMLRDFLEEDADEEADLQESLSAIKVTARARFLVPRAIPEGTFKFTSVNVPVRIF